MTAVGFVPLLDDAGVAVSGDEGGKLWRWDTGSGEQVGEPIQAHDSQIAMIRGLSGTKEPLFVSSDHEGVLKRWNAITGAEVGEALEPGAEVYSLATAIVRDVGVLFAAGADDTVRAWVAESGEPIGLSLEGRVVSALTRPDGTSLVVTSTARGEISVHTCSFDAE
ncbi:WD40 repeat domain-containing protein [Streptomyces sp. NBC_00715]|uniref:hypothetical protein n=1 Tax=Streptomyces sp. NBC_00715 TaxID=2975811 RepID=UPI003870DF69